MDERELLARLRAGEPAAERQFYDLHVDRVYRLAYRMTRDESMARESTQETFVRAFDRLSGFRGEAALSTWLYRIGVSVIINGLRKMKRYRRYETDFDAAGHAEAHTVAGDPSLRERLQRAMTRLPDILRAVFVMHDMEGYKHEEIAGILDIPVGTSKARLSRARAALRKDLSDLAPEGIA